jgi:hypothetical protein
MSVTYYVALPFVRTEDGSAAGQAMECQSAPEANRKAEAMSRDPANVTCAWGEAEAVNFEDWSAFTNATCAKSAYKAAREACQ